MGISILDNFDYRAGKPNFTRDLFATVEEMVAFPEMYLPSVFECNVTDTGDRYRYNVNNDVDPVTGKWRLVTGGTGGSVDGYTKGEVNTLLNKKLDKPETDGTEGQVLTVQADGTNAYQDVPQYDDTEIQEAIANKLDKPIVDGAPGQTLVLQDDNTLAYQDNVAETPIATVNTVGTVKPDGTTITVNEDGVITAVGGGSSEKQIKDWVSGSSYLEGDYIYHEGELYRCLASNNDVNFDETNWKQLTYGIDELSKEDVERLLGLTKEEIEAMTDLILDTEVRIDKTYSSSKIYTDIEQCLEDSKTYTLEELEKVKIDDTLTTTDKTITGAINEVNGNLLDTVGFSADYKNIILNRKNGLNPYTIPISAIINNASLAELKDIDSTDVGDGKTLVYDGITNKHKYVDSSITDEFVKMDSTTDAKYLSDLIDKSTVVNDNGVLKVKKLDGQEVTITEINYLKGLTMNVMDLVNAFSNGGVKVLNTPLNTASELDTMDRTSFTDGISYIVYVLADETHSNAKTTYLCTKTSTIFFGNADSQRNFTTNPIDLANEVTGKLGTSNIDVDNLWTSLTINDTYKTLTTNNEIFGTHGAKAMYDELATDIGGKANATDLTTHTGDANIHVTTTDKAKWDKVTDKLDAVDFNTHKDNTDIHITSAERTKWDKVDKKVDKTSITTTINSTSTDNTVPSTKSVYTNILSLLRNQGMTEEQINSNIETFYIGTVSSDVGQAIGLPLTNGILGKIINIPHGTYTIQLAWDVGKYNNIFMLRKCSDGVWQPWQKVCTTKVADVDVTTITPVNSAITGTIEYTVKNGICYVSLINLKSTINNFDLSISTTMPKPAINSRSPIFKQLGSGNIGFVYINKNTTQLTANIYTSDTIGDCSFSYPVAE